MLHVSATQETGRSDRRMAAQGVRFPPCAGLALQTVHVKTPDPTPLSEPSDVFPAWADVA